MVDVLSVVRVELVVLVAVNVLLTVAVKVVDEVVLLPTEMLTVPVT